VAPSTFAAAKPEPPPNVGGMLGQVLDAAADTFLRKRS
jgi:hypothetical protein